MTDQEHRALYIQELIECFGEEGIPEELLDPEYRVEAAEWEDDSSPFTTWE